MKFNLKDIRSIVREAIREPVIFKKHAQGFGPSIDDPTPGRITVDQAMMHWPEATNELIKQLQRIWNDPNDMYRDDLRRFMGSQPRYPRDWLKGARFSQDPRGGLSVEFDHEALPVLDWFSDEKMWGVD